MKKRMFLFAAMLMVLLISTGCSRAPIVKRNSEIINDLSNTKKFFETYPEFTINGIDVVKRQTDVSNRTDTVYVTLSVINDDESISGYIDMELLYELYNEGWILEECSWDWDGANSGSYFRPEKAIDLSFEEVSSDLKALTGEIFSDVAIYDVEVDLENGTVTYSVTGTEYHTYMTGEIDATLTYKFFNSVGYWEAPFLTINSYDEHWHIAGKFNGPKISVSGFELVIDDTIDTLSIGVGATLIENIHIYKVSDNTLKQVMGEYLSAASFGWNSYDEYVTKYDFSVALTEDFTNYYSFEYVAWWKKRGMLFIGKDQLGHIDNDFEVDVFNRRVVCEIYELFPIE